MLREESKERGTERVRKMSPEVSRVFCLGT